MKYIDLTHTFTAHMPTYPGDLDPEMTQIGFFDKDGYNDFQIKTGMHVGTHIDAPLHMIEDGSRIPELPLEMFFGRGHLIVAVGRAIDVDLMPKDAKKGDILIINTGFYKRFREKGYYEEFPEITEAFARKAVEIGISIIGTDTASPDRPPFAVHRILLGNNVLIIENLANLDSLKGEDFDVCALPMKLDTEAAPVRVVAMLR